MRIKTLFFNVLFFLMLTISQANPQLTAPHLSSIEGVYIPNEINLFVGDSINLNTNFEYELSELAWSSSNPEVVSVNNGVVVANKKGVVTVSVHYGQYDIDLDVYVSNRVINLTPKKGVLLLNGDAIQLSATDLNVDVSAHVNWYSGNEHILTVENGVVQAVGVGSTFIVANYTLLNETDTAFFDVIDNSQNLYDISPTELHLSVGQRQLLELSPKIDNSDDAVQYWAIDNPEVASVDQLGFVTALGVGKTNIRIVALGQEKVVPITVYSNQISIYAVPNYSELLQGDSLQITLKERLGSFSKELDDKTKTSWLSSDSNIASVSDDGMVRAINSGRVTISGFYENNFSSLVVLVKSIEGLPIISPTILSLSVGESQQAFVKNFSTGNEMSKLIWVSDDENVAMVDEKGLVLGIQEGSTIIKAYAISELLDNSEAKLLDKAVVNVSKNTQANILDVPVYEFSLNKGEWISFADAFPLLSNTSRMAINTGESVQIDQLFNINAVAVGSAIVKCFNADGLLGAVCKIVVEDNESWKPGVKKIQLRDLKTVVVEFNTDMFISLDNDLKDIVLVEILRKETGNKSGSMIDVAQAYFEDGTRTLVIILSREINIFEGEALRIYSDSGFIAMNKGVSFELFIGDVNSITASNAPKSAKLKMYPNPVKEELQLESSVVIKKIEIYSQQGILQYNNEGVHALNKVIKLSGLTTGLYFVRVEDVNGDSKTLKVFKE